MSNSETIYRALARLSEKYNPDSETTILRNYAMVFDPFGLVDIPELGLKTNTEYITKELDWYKSQSLNVNTLRDTPKIWRQVCDSRNHIHSNYGFLIFNSFNGNQYDNVLKELTNNPTSRRAVMYYTNPMMHYIGNKDHICTLAVVYYIDKRTINCSVIMRSQDIIFGLLNDLPWQQWVLKRLAVDLGNIYAVGDIHWFCVNLHIYKRHYKYLEMIRRKYDN